MEMTLTIASNIIFLMAILSALVNIIILAAGDGASVIEKYVGKVFPYINIGIAALGNILTSILLIIFGKISYIPNNSLPKNNNPLYLALGIAGFVILIVIIFFTIKISLRTTRLSKRVYSDLMPGKKMELDAKLKMGDILECQKARRLKEYYAKENCLKRLYRTTRIYATIISVTTSLTIFNVIGRIVFAGNIGAWISKYLLIVSADAWVRIGIWLAIMIYIDSYSFKSIKVEVAAKKRVVVFGGTRIGNKSDFENAARTIGKFIAKSQLTLIFDGSNVGLMEVLLDENKANFGEAIEIGASVKKEKLLELGAGFIILPGGLGTLDEATDLLERIHIKRVRKPVVFLNVAGYYDHLNLQLQRMAKDGFISSSWLENVRFVEDAESTMEYIINWR